MCRCLVVSTTSLTPGLCTATGVLPPNVAFMLNAYSSVECSLPRTNITCVDVAFVFNKLINVYMVKTKKKVTKVDEPNK